MDITLYNEYFMLNDFESIIDDSVIFKNTTQDQEYIEAAYTEVTTGTTSQNIFVKIIRFIVRMLKLLWSKVVQLFRWLKNKILGKNKKSADQSVEEVIGSDLSGSSSEPRARAPRKVPRGGANNKNDKEENSNS